MCGYTPEAAVWTEEGLSAWLDSHPVPRASRSTAPGDGLPFDGELDGVRPQALRTVTFEPQGDHGASFLSMDHLGMLVSSGPARPEEQVRQDFRAFAANVSAANATTLHAAEESFVASAETGGEFQEADENGTVHSAPFVSYHVLLPGPYRLEELVASLDLAWPDLAADPYREPGTVHAFADGWSFDFQVAHWTVALDRGSITVDALDRVKVSGVFAEDDGDADVERKVRRAFEAAGLPEPHLEGMTHGGSIC